jgi:HAD superfamily hydrolase (TIGR01490 family)
MMKNKNGKKLALFDFDGTISTKDTFIEFLKYAKGPFGFWIGFLRLSPWLIGFFAGFVPSHRMKSMVMTHFFKDMDEAAFNRIATEFGSGNINQFVKQSALERLQWHKDEGHEIAVVSASFSNWLAPWCDTHNIHLIATQLEIVDNRVTGKLSSPNCKGPEKVRRIKELFQLENYSYIYAYGNSSGDKEMLELANEPYMNNFK